ncbi:hypothetical protein, partial [Variovorax defluvii]|uniref:hypothetical protein n=1 Tax=Variovorax defluvii TaxID=913761 RepID=UPI0031E8BA4F
GLAALPSAGPLNVTIALPEGYVRTFSRTSITGAYRTNRTERRISTTQMWCSGTKRSSEKAGGNE